MTRGPVIAIVGMAGRFPGAPNLARFWQNLKDGVESIRSFTDAELLAAGVSQEELSQPEYVKSGAVLEEMDMFDASFFGFSPKDAAIMDPQHRVFLECAWEALENAGHAPGIFAGSVGVYAGSGMNSYMIHNLLTNPALVASAGLFLIRQTGNDKDVLATRVSYQLNLHGPSISVQTACSTSLVAVHLACQSLLNYECDVALAGGVTIEFPHGRGYLYREGEILSRDGHCRAFAADSSGTVFSSGAGIVVLRRLEDALADRDTIHAVILGSAVNNDGARKAGYLAPSVDGQAEAITEALGVAGVQPADISYIETHGTGTRVGDPIEIKALTQAFRGIGQATGPCAIGSLKTNIGHLDTAAGVAGLIKTVLSLKHRQIPPSLHFHKANPLIDFENSPFRVNAELTEWKTVGGPRRAGVTSLGIGGTNAHVVLEEAPAPNARPATRKPCQLLVLSAKTASALEPLSQNLCTHLDENPDLLLQDVAFTCQTGRKALPHRRAVTVADIEEARRLLRGESSSRVFTGQAAEKAPEVVFMFSGQGSQYVNMGRQLYETEPIFRTELDRCADHLAPDLGLDLRALLYPPENESAAAAEKLSRTRFTQPALFSIEYAIAQWWISHGVTPAAMIGHSIGEYAAACLAGVFSLEDGLRITALRGRLMDEMPRGSMLATSASPDALQIPKELTLAAVNGPEQCVVSGPSEAIREYARQIENRGISHRELHTSHAFHSAMMDPMLESFRTEMAKVALSAPKIGYISNLTGTWITPDEAVSPEYWTRHLRHTVQFAPGLSELFRETSRLYLEVGPGQALTSLTRQHPGRPKVSRVFSSMRHPQDRVSDASFLLSTTGQLWIAGCSVAWDILHSGEKPQRIPLPTYPFERKRHWIEPKGTLLGRETTAASASAPVVANDDSLFQRRAWKRVAIERTTSASPRCWLVFLDELGLGAEISSQLRAHGHTVLQVSVGSTYTRTGTGMYEVRPGIRGDYDQLLADIGKNEQLPSRIIHLWPLTGSKTHPNLDQTLDLSFYSLLFLAQAMGDQDLQDIEITCVSNGLHSISGEATFRPERASLLGPVRVIPKEFSGTHCRNVDLDWEIGDLKRVASGVITECLLSTANSCVAWRRYERWVETFEPSDLLPQPSSRLKEKGVYWITGGVGGIGLVIAEYLSRKVRARLVLSGRTPIPPVAQWDTILAQPSDKDGLQQTIRKLRELESLGSEILTIAADVTDRAQMEGAARTIENRFGTINGVIHAAGLTEDEPLQIKTRESANRVLAPKIQGTLVLGEVLNRYKLDFFFLFSSVSSLTPPPGQIDYAGANAFLDAFALSYRTQPTTALNWGLWNDVGMGARYMAGNQPIIGRQLVQSSSESIYSTRLSCQKDWLLAEHRFKTGEALIPGTGYLQLAATALVRNRFEKGVEFEDVFFLAPLSVPAEETREARLRLRRLGATHRFSIIAKDKEWIEYASGQVARNQRPAPPVQSVDQIRQRCSQRRIVFDENHRTRQEQYFDFGQRWQNLQTLLIGNREALAELQLREEFLGDLQSWFLHPALLDMATGSSLYVITGYEESKFLYLPLSYKKATFYRPLTGKVYSHIRCHQDNTVQREIATFDFILLDAQGQVLAEIDQFSLRRISATAESPVSAHLTKSISTHVDAKDSFAPEGISSSEGIKAFDQVLNSNLPSNVIIVRGTLAEEPAEFASISPEKRKTATDDSVGSVLAGWWEELLGVEKVGLDDDFFDLGGHSLVAVRLFSRIKKTFAVDLALSILFEARTVRKLASLIQQAGDSGTRKETEAPAVVAIRGQGSRLPLFLISGLGGELIAFDTLAHSLGADQPVFALQPQGLDGRRPFLTRVEDMAAYYLDEIRKVQASGPYCLAGYSFGGYVAFEIAQQLNAAGETVGLLGFLDTIEWQYLQRVGRLESFRERWAQRFDHLKSGRWEYVRRTFVLKSVKLVYRFFHKLGREVPQEFSNLEDINRFAMSLYKPTVYPGPLTIFRSLSREAASENDELLGWGGLVSGGIEVHDVTGRHLEMLKEPNVRVLAARLRSRLDRVQHLKSPEDSNAFLVKGTSNKDDFVV